MAKNLVAMDNSTEGGVMRANKLVRIGIIGLTVGTMFAAAPAAMAKGGGGKVTNQGSCSGAADWKISVKPEDGGKLQVEFEVEHAKPGQTWAVRMTDNGTQIFSGSRTANSLHKFQVRKLTNNRAGSDTVAAKATNNATGQVCNASATL
jgi:hypothetical protein